MTVEFFVRHLGTLSRESDPPPLEMDHARCSSIAVIDSGASNCRWRVSQRLEQADSSSSITRTDSLAIKTSVDSTVKV